MYMIFCVLDNPDLLDDVLAAWRQAGISGVTIMETTGMFRQIQQHIPMRYAFGSPQTVESGNITLMALARDEALVNKCLAATEEITGNLDGPNTGVFAAWPVAILKGVPQAKTGPGEGG
ncbi:MAG TPA: hypothetical protein PKW33_13710 [Anaerolineaceae bacterium]|nr:hypothetical protein [Anaerolineaceae bacterium]HPN52643.1 hypothetical protein [Anaerolineaceae bacterium]